MSVVEMIKTHIITVVLAMFFAFPVFAQQKQTPAQKQFADEHRLRETPRFSLKTNLLYDMTTTVSLGTEFKLARKITFDVPFHLNPWTFNTEENVKFKFMLVQPQLRFWTCEVFNGHFFGLHGHYGYYNVSALPNPPFSEKMNQSRFEGQLYGAGLSYGYQWIIGRRFGLEFEIGGGYAKLEYDEYSCQVCARENIAKVKEYWGLTRLGLSLIYFIF